MIKTTPLPQELLSVWTMREPADTMYRVCFYKSNTAFQTHVLFPLVASWISFSVPILPFLNPSCAETLVQTVTRSFCNCYIPFPASPFVSWTCSFAKSTIHSNLFFVLSLISTELSGKKKKERKGIHALQELFIFPLNKSCCFMNVLSKVNN